MRGCRCSPDLVRERWSGVVEPPQSGDPLGEFPKFCLHPFSIPDCDACPCVCGRPKPPPYGSVPLVLVTGRIINRYANKALYPSCNGPALFQGAPVRLSILVSCPRASTYMNHHTPSSPEVLSSPLQQLFIVDQQVNNRASVDITIIRPRKETRQYRKDGYPRQNGQK